MSDTGPFSDSDEERGCIRWMIDLCKDYRRKIADQGQYTLDVFDESSDFDELGEALTRIASIISYCEDRLLEIEMGEDNPPSINFDTWQTVWNSFASISATLGEPVTIHDHKLNTNDYLEFGYSDQIYRTSIFAGGTEVTHLYKGLPPDVSWQVHLIEQKGKSFYIASAKICEIDAVCSVPSLPEHIESAESGMRVVDGGRGDDEWQRRLAPKRINSIRSFIEGSNNIIANTPILFVKPKTGAVEIKDGILSVNFESFLKKTNVKGRGELWYDAVPQKEDFRPIWLIDGQHRVRGMSRSQTGKELEVPVIIFPEEFQLHEAAKIFAEINTLQTKLTALHTLFMQHRFHIPSPKSKRDFFPKEWDEDDPAHHNSRANHLSYEAAGYLASNIGGPLYNRIRILDQNAQNYTVVKADQWVDFGRSWFLKNGPYHPGCGMNQEQINSEIENYFSAVIETCNHNEWTDGMPRWSPNSMNKGLIQRHSHFKVLIDIFPVVWELSTGPGVSIPIPVKRFKEALKPLKWVDWLHPDMKSTFGGGGEKGRSCLRVWMEDAIRNGESYELDEVMSSTIKSIPGKGIHASPGEPELTIEGDVKWPSRDSPVKMVASRPANALLTSYWEIVDSDGAGRTEDETSLAKPNRNQATFEIHHKEWMDDMDFIDVAVNWRNAASPPTGRKELRLKNTKRVG